MSKLILDVRSGERNDPSTGLCLRVVDGSVSEVDGRYERVGRDLYEIGNNGVESYALIASGDGEIGKENVDISFKHLGGNKYLTNSRYWLTEVRNASGEQLPHYFGGTVVSSEVDISNTNGEGLVGGLFWWTRNDSSRVRYSYENRGWSLLSGSAGVQVGVVGDEDDIVVGSLSGELRIGGGNVSDANVTVFKIGSDEFRLVKEGEEEATFNNNPGVEGVVLNPSGKVLFKEGTSFTGKSILFIAGTLGRDVSSVVSSGDYLSPKPLPNEYPLMRINGYGYSQVEFVDTEADLDVAEYGVVKVSRDSGKILCEGSVKYDGLVLCDAPVGVQGGIDLGNTIGGVSDGVPVIDVPDGSGLEPSGVSSGFRPNGSGLKWEYKWLRMYVLIGETILPVEIVEKLPKRLSFRKAYVIDGYRKVYLSSGWSGDVSTLGHKLFSGHVSLSRGGLRHTSILKLEGNVGSIKIDGQQVNYNGDVITGNGVSSIDGHLVVNVGSTVDHPETINDFENLKKIGLVPSSTLETGLEFVLTNTSVKGYFSYDEEKVADISGNSAFQFLQFEPRVDFDGYETGKFFKIGDKVLGDTDVETAFGGSPNGFHWITERQVSSKVNEETSRIDLGSGLRVGSTEITITQEQIDGTISRDVLAENIGYDLPNLGLEGQARLISRLGAEVLRGQQRSNSVGLTIDIGVDLSSVKEGDFFYDGLNYFKIESITGTVITLSSVLGLQEGGRWKIFGGYREGVESAETPDPTRIVGEILDSLDVLERSPVEIYKVYSTLAFEKVLPGSKLFIRKTENNVELTYPLFVLRDSVLEAPYELPSGDHYTSGSYRIKVGVVEYEVGVGENDKGFTVSNNRVVFESPMGTPNSSWVEGDVIFVRKPRVGLTDLAEMDLGLNIQTPFTPSNEFVSGVHDFLELLTNPNFEANSGAISFEEPLDSGVGVEVSYTPTDDPSSRIIESMGFVVLQEEATRVNGNEFSYNPNNKEVELLATPTVMVGPEQIDPSLYNIDQNKILFSFPVDSSKSVKLSYTTLKSNGGDATVRTSSGMVIPKYKIDKGSTSLVVHRDLTSILEVNDLINVGTQAFYISAISSTSITVTPPARFSIEASTISFLNVPRFTYDGSVSQSAFRNVINAIISAKPKSPDIFLQGDYRGFIKSKSLIVLKGIPYRVNTIGIDDSTGMTKVTVDGFTSGHSFTSTNDFFVSYRPVLIEGDKSLVLNTGLVESENFQFIKYDHSIGRGRLLSQGQDFRLNAEAGLIDLLGSHQVSPQVSYYLLHTALSAVKPITLLGGRVSKPSYKAKFNQSVPPTQYNGLALNVKCLVSSPDTFQIRVADESSYSEEIANELQQSLNQSAGSGGKLSVVSSATSQGKAIGIYDLLANDVVARSRINLYNGYVQPVDDLVSTTTGKVIGDTDGSFKFSLLTSGDWIAPGLEDPITREIYPRYVSMEYLTPLNPANPYYPVPEDPIVISGIPMDDLSKYLGSILEKQRPLIENEMDDYVLIRQREKTSFDSSVGFPFIKTDYIPVYKPMWERHRFSRLFPTNTKMYSFRTPGRLNTETNGNVIGNVQNNSIGQIENITSLSVVTKRPARFRVYDFSLTGFSGAPASVGKPTFIVSAVPFDEFPIDSITGLPDTTQFVINGGLIPDASVGNVDRTFNGLTPNQNSTRQSKIKLSQNGGEFFNVLNTAQEASIIDIGFPPLQKTAPRNAKVLSVIDGCYVVLEGNPFTLKVNGKSLVENPPKRGDTLIESYARDLDDDSSPSTYFRVGSDIGLKRATGELVDISLPSIDDPDWPIKEIIGQNVPDSGIALEGNVEFTYTETTPFNYPALQGDTVNDAGDESIPFMSRFSERDLLPQIPPALNGLKVQTNSEYVYPDEARGTANINSGAIITNEDFSGLNGVCEQAPRQGDLVILKPDASAATGVLEIAEINGTEILPPAYTTPGDVSCTIQNLQADFRQNPNGVFIEEDWPINQSTGIHDRSELKMYFYQHTIEELFNNPQAGLEITIHIHNFGGNSTAPYENAHSFIFKYDGANWEVSLKNEITNAVTTVPNLVVSATAPSELTIIQDPVPNPFDPATDTWNDPADMESWLFKNYWDEVYHFYNAYLINASIGYIFTQEQNGSMSPSNYRISVKSNATISNNRVDVVFPLSLVPHAVIEINPDPTIDLTGGADTDRKLTIDGTTLNVKEEGGVQTGTITSDVNNGTFDFSLVNSTTLRPLYLDGITRSNDPMSIFIGAEVNETEVILQGSARSSLVNSAGDEDTGRGVLRNITPTSGAAANVLTGDLLYIESGHNAGTHRVLDNITLSGSETYLDKVKTETLGSSQVYKVKFPKIVSLDSNTITTDVEDLTDYFKSTSGSFYVLMDSSYTTNPRSVPDGVNGASLTYVKDPIYGATVIKVEYTNVSGSDFTINPATIASIDGVAIAFSDFNTLLDSYQQTIGGIDKIPFNLNGTGEATSIPVSFDVELSLSFAVGGGYTGTTSVANGNAYTDAQVIRDSSNLVTHLTFDTTDQTLFPLIVDLPAGSDYGQAFLTPNDTITAKIKVNEGIYLDPSFPKLLRDYRGTTPVKFGDGSSQVRTPIDSTITNLPGWAFYEEVNITVRRLRRFTDVFSKLIYAFEGFRYLYEQRIGRVNTITKSNNLAILTPLPVDGNGANDPNGKDTQVGMFADVVSVGDQIQCFNGSNQETLYLRILEIGATLKCSVIRGAISNVVGNDVFKVITRTPLIPELQAFNQFVDHGFTEIYATDPIAGISVNEVNKLTDTNANFLGLVEVGDFLVIDPQGALASSNPVEYGAPPRGDNGDGTVGTPNPLDDNRGAYKVTNVVDNTNLEVEFYAGSGGTTRTDYKLLPSVGGDDTQPLRITASIVGSSYATNPESIHPFSYKILRRNTTLEEPLAGSVLFFRERTLSWVELIRSFNNLPTQPYTWAQYEAEDLIDEVGISDASHPSNDLLLQSILGNESSPFINSETCLSVYDRRMLIEDPKMTTEMNRAPEDGISTVLENDISSMNARDSRYAWISVRTEQVNGTLAKLSRVDLENPDDTALEDIK